MSHDSINESDPGTVDNSVTPDAFRFSKRRLRVEIFPVTTLILAQYGTLAIVPALVHKTAPLALIIGICLAGFGGAFATEALIAPIGRSKREAPLVDWAIARWVLIIGLVSQLAVAASGRLSYATQIGTGTQSPLASYATPLQYWSIIGVALLLWTYRAGGIARSRVLVLLLVTMGIQLVIAIVNARLGPFTIFAFTVVFLGLLVRLIRFRWVLVLLMIASLALPTFFSIRNQSRINAGANAASVNSATVSNRFRIDLEIAQIQRFPTIPAAIPLPSLAKLLEFGLIPSVFDAGRGSLASGESLSVALGGSNTNAASLTTLGEIYAYYGWWGVIAYVVLGAILLGYLIRRPGAWIFCIFTLAVSQLFFIEATVPDVFAGFLQSLISLLFAFILYALLKPKDGKDGRFFRTRTGNLTEELPRVNVLNPRRADDRLH